MDSEPFPRLRTGYLRAVARAWRDPEYARLLCRESKTHRNGVLPRLEKDFGFKFAFDIKFSVDDKHSPVWNPVQTGGWVGAADAFKIYLPRKPAKMDERASLLARYFQEYPTLLGRPRTSGLRASQAPADFSEFGGTTLRALALCWSDSGFAEQLFHASDARSLIQDYFDHVVVWNFKLLFAEHPEPLSDDPAYFESFPPSEILVHLPRRPGKGDGEGVEDVELEPIALAAYNGTGSQYPFTCG